MYIISLTPDLVISPLKWPTWFPMRTQRTGQQKVRAGYNFTFHQLRNVLTSTAHQASEEEIDLLQVNE